MNQRYAGFGFYINQAFHIIRILSALRAAGNQLESIVIGIYIRHHSACFVGGNVIQIVQPFPAPLRFAEYAFFSVGCRQSRCPKFSVQPLCFSLIFSKKITDQVRLNSFEQSRLFNLYFRFFESSKLPLAKTACPIISIQINFLY